MVDDALVSFRISQCQVPRYRFLEGSYLLCFPRILAYVPSTTRSFCCKSTIVLLTPKQRTRVDDPLRLMVFVIFDVITKCSCRKRFNEPCAISGTGLVSQSIADKRGGSPSSAQRKEKLPHHENGILTPLDEALSFAHLELSRLHDDEYRHARRHVSGISSIPSSFALQETMATIVIGAQWGDEVHDPSKTPKHQLRPLPRTTLTLGSCREKENSSISFALP
jgi:hypothetical protein